MTVVALWLREIKLDLTESESSLLQCCASHLGLDPLEIKSFRILRRAIDARRKSRILRVYTVEFSVADEARLLLDHVNNPHLQAAPLSEPRQAHDLRVPHRVLIVGMGPCGLFAAKDLAEAGAQVTLIEQGRPVEQRAHDVDQFWAGGDLNPTSNVQFGEGGAGTFSDGKLTTRINHPRLRDILESLVACGAPGNILVDARPHIGTDKLRKILIKFRRKLEELGVDLRFESCLTGLEADRGRIVAGHINGTDRLACQALLLAPGHSCRATYRMLQDHGVGLEAKSFAIGLRVEHPADLINRAQYGRQPPGLLPAADYSLRYNDPLSGRGVYSFCMCPGGEVINAASEPGGLVVNGMSRSARTGQSSNSALVVTVQPADWGETQDPLGGMLYQQHWERLAFQAGGGAYHAPAQNLLAFMGLGSGPVSSSCRPAVVEAELDRLLPNTVVSGLRAALPKFNQQIRDFLTREAVLIGVETRTSAPLRILRSELGESVTHAGLFPAGEGAGYAGGIMSSALDGLMAAERIIQSSNNRSLV